jgi:hypothetical protein
LTAHDEKHGSCCCLASPHWRPLMPTAPGAGFKRHAEDTFISPDKKVRVEQYSKDLKDWRALYQFWTFDRDRRHGFLLNPGEDDDVAGYAAGFRFSPDSQWLVRMQKLGAGYQTLFLYRRNGYQFSPATTKPLGDLAWDFFFPTPESKGMHRNPKDPYSLRRGHFRCLPTSRTTTRKPSSISASMSFTGVRAGSRHSKS